MAREHEFSRPRSIGGYARYKLGLRLPKDRHAAAQLLWDAHTLISRLKWMPCRIRWQRSLELAASWALEAAEEADDTQQFRLFDHIAYVMERTVGMEDIIEHG